MTLSETSWNLVEAPLLCSRSRILGRGAILETGQSDRLRPGKRSDGRGGTEVYGAREQDSRS
jgi:hypothetical protein